MTARTRGARAEVRTLAKKRQHKNKQSEAPFSVQIATYSQERLQQIKASLERQRADLQQRWARLEHIARGHQSLHQVRDVEHRLALVESRLHAFAATSQTEPETPPAPQEPATAKEAPAGGGAPSPDLL